MMYLNAFAIMDDYNNLLNLVLEFKIDDRETIGTFFGKYDLQREENKYKIVSYGLIFEPFEYFHKLNAQQGINVKKISIDDFLGFIKNEVVNSEEFYNIKEDKLIDFTSVKTSFFDLGDSTIYNKQVSKRGKYSDSALNDKGLKK